MSLELLTAYAVSNKSSTAKVHLSKLPVEEARKQVKIKDGNRKKVTDGSQALTLVLGRHVLPLDIIDKGASRVVAPADKIEEFSGILQSAVDAGSFDAEIIAAQKLSIPKPRKPSPAPMFNGANPGVAIVEEEEQEPELETASADDIDGLDFGSIEV